MTARLSPFVPAIALLGTLALTTAATSRGQSAEAPLTLVAETHAPDEVYEEARAQFSEAELVKLTVAIGMINTWNRIAIGFRVIHPVRTEVSA